MVSRFAAAGAATMLLTVFAPPAAAQTNRPDKPTWWNKYEYLLANGAKPDLVDDMGKSPVDLVSGGRGDGRSKEIVSLLQKVATQP